MYIKAEEVGIGHRILTDGKSFIVYNISKPSSNQKIIFHSRDNLLHATVNCNDMIKIINKKRKNDGRTV